MRPRVKSPLTAERLRELFVYDPKTGHFYNRVYRSSNAKPGQIAGTLKEGRYIQINCDGILCYAHRLAYLYMTGELPDLLIDHRNGNGTDNRWKNIRLATDAENSQNRKGPDSDNQSGYLGVYPNRDGTFTAQLVLGRRKVFVKKCRTALGAYRAYLKAKREHHPFQTIAK